MFKDKPLDHHDWHEIVWQMGNYAGQLYASALRAKQNRWAMHKGLQRMATRKMRLGVMLALSEEVITEDLLHSLGTGFRYGRQRDTWTEGRGKK